MSEPQSRSPGQTDTERTLSYPTHANALPPGTLQGGRYYLRFANSEADLRAIQRLRFEVFNLELAEGLDSAYTLGRDEDEFDQTCHHLMVLLRGTEQVVGTYRIMTYPMAQGRGGFYSETEFEFSGLPAAVQREAIEVGRACVAAEHRNGRVIHLLWRGLARYLSWNKLRYLFGCCSVPTLDEDRGQELYERLQADGYLHPEIRLSALPALVSRGNAVEADGKEELPALFESYLNIGAQVCSVPAVDRQFKVIDFLVLLDLHQLDKVVERKFFGTDRWIEPGVA